jgi:hypothetical protein
MTMPTRNAAMAKKIGGTTIAMPCKLVDLGGDETVADLARPVIGAEPAIGSSSASSASITSSGTASALILSARWLNAPSMSKAAATEASVIHRMP